MIPERGVIAVVDSGIDRTQQKADAVIGIQLHHSFTDKQRMAVRAHVHIGVKIVVAVIGDHIHIDHAENGIACRAGGSCVIAAAEQARLLLIPERINDGVRIRMAGHDASCFDHSRTAAGIIIGAGRRQRGGHVIVMRTEDVFLMWKTPPQLFCVQVSPCGAETLPNGGEAVGFQLAFQPHGGGVVIRHRGVSRGDGRLQAAGQRDRHGAGKLFDCQLQRVQ
ncbi:MAG: hypothetical protein BWY83_02519 [bacterium ADurb.Bin478]|nr:MAG: hypothetical protein BWY83_02519 [bacterium ADurb.Bin478]